MATYGPVGIGQGSDDGQEDLPTNVWRESGHDSDGNRIGWTSSSGGIFYNIGMRWDNVTIPPGSTITSCTVEVGNEYKDGTGDAPVKMTGILELDPVTFDPGGSNRPGLRTQTSGAEAVDFFLPNSEYVDNTRYVLNTDFSPVMQAIIDQPGWASGNAVVFVLNGSNAGAVNTRWQMQDYNRDPGNVYELTVEYDEVVVPTFIPAWAKNANGIVGVL